MDFEVISAHRNPDRLEERLGEVDFDSVIAGAGISAHLPGVVASKVMVPVFGIPVGSQFSRLGFCDEYSDDAARSPCVVMWSNNLAFVCAIFNRHASAPA